jgi:alpha-L-rhamnosidase
MTKTIFTILLIIFSIEINAQTKITNLKCEYQDSPINIDDPTPALSWQITGNERNTNQTAYRILVADDPDVLKKDIGNVWDSKKISSSASIQIIYGGKKLQSSKAYYWKAMIWDNHHKVSGWSKVNKWQIGLLTNADWQGAKWIGYENMPDSLRIVPAIDNSDDKRWATGKDILPLLSKQFSVSKKVKSAIVYISGLGQFELSLNGKKVGDHFMDPGWTKYDKHALYVTFDVSDQLRNGENALGVMLGNGFYFVPGARYHKLKGAFGYPKMICRLAITYNDGSEENIISNQTWKTAPGPITFSSIYGGEDHDANLEQDGWNMPGYNNNTWRNAVITDGPGELDAQQEEPLKIFDHFSPKKIFHPKQHVWVYDMGQNASGIPYITVSGKKGDKVKITPAELLDTDSTVTQDAVGSPVYFRYTLKGAVSESWHPQFMYYGFRYIQVEGAVPAGQPNPDHLPVIDTIESLHTRNAATRIGAFSCSNELFNKTFTLIDWAIKSNTVSIFTDCPHREKLGWLEEAHLVGASIRYNYDIATLCRKVVNDMMKSQTPEGLIPDIAPEYVQFADGFRDSPEWGSNGIIMPWYIYQWYGDKQVLQQSYNMMQRYVAYLEKRSKNHILYFGLGDWYDLGPEDPGGSQLTPEGITSTAIYYYDLAIMAQVASVLGNNEDAVKYEKLGAEVRSAYNQTFFDTKTGEYGTGSQTANAMSVYMGLVEPVYKQAVINNIVADIRKHNNALTSGDIGYRYLLRVLDDAGRSDVIFDMNSRTDVPGYGYQLAHGATALTESWQGNTSSSNNHFMLGHLMEWFYSGLGGIKQDPNTVAFKKMIIRPEIVGDVTHASASYLSPYGLIANSWNKTGSSFNMRTQIPVNTTAVIYLPVAKNSILKENNKPVINRHDIKLLKIENGKAQIAVGSGSYNFSVTAK